jgi:hypothetical protein
MKLRYSIHYTLPTGEEDWFTAAGETIEEILEIAWCGIDQHCGTYLWAVPILDENNS